MPDWIQRFSLQGRTALVTGASRGIGLEICRVFADAGADIIATARDEKGLQAAADAVRQTGRYCHILRCDLTDPAAIANMAQAALDIGTIDILVNNAGVARVAPAATLDLAAWDETMAVNVRAPFQLAQCLAPKMIEQRWGKIINISSQAGIVAFADHAAYSASKAAMNALTRALMSEWSMYNIQVNAICPTVILTDMGKEIWSPTEKSAPFIERTPLGRFGEPIEVADMALYLASPASGLINGETLLLDGGYSAV